MMVLPAVAYLMQVSTKVLHSRLFVWGLNVKVVALLQEGKPFVKISNLERSQRGESF